MELILRVCVFVSLTIQEFKNARFIKLEFFNMFLTLGINGNNFVSHLNIIIIYTVS